MFFIKILEMRLRECLGNLISPNQTAFLNERSISKNILLAHELVEGYHRNKEKERCANKVDLKKAYGKINWSFILMCLLSVGCPPRFVNWVGSKPALLPLNTL